MLMLLQSNGSCHNALTCSYVALKSADRSKISGSEISKAATLASLSVITRADERWRTQLTAAATRSCLAFSAATASISSLSAFPSVVICSTSICSASIRSASIRSASLRSKRASSAAAASAAMLSASICSASTRSASKRTASTRSALIRSTSLRSASIRAASIRSALMRSASNLSCSALSAATHFTSTRSCSASSFAATCPCSATASAWSSIHFLSNFITASFFVLGSVPRASSMSRWMA
mmetsp:Transcript_25314/g.51627  ORF Transcript_25314/g.51627 Transcript_25314/m.51627 type:complete len:240 (-) Transcript_25314:440-1159(-)